MSELSTAKDGLPDYNRQMRAMRLRASGWSGIAPRILTRTEPRRVKADSPVDAAAGRKCSVCGMFVAGRALIHVEGRVYCPDHAREPERRTPDPGYFYR